MLRAGNTGANLKTCVSVRHQVLTLFSTDDVSGLRKESMAPLEEIPYIVRLTSILTLGLLLTLILDTDFSGQA